MTELHVGAFHLQTVLRGRSDPLIDGILAGAGVDVVLLHFETFGLLGNEGGPVRVHRGQELGVGQGRAFEEPPAVFTLLQGRERAEVRIVVVTGRALHIGSCFDDHGDLAAVPGIVGTGRDLEAQLVAARNGKAVKAEAYGIVVAVALPDLDLRILQKRTVVPDLHDDAVRPVRIGILMAELHVFAGNVDAAALSCDPLVDGIPAFAGVDVAVLHFQAVGASREPSEAVGSRLGQDSNVADAPSFQEEPAVSALLHGAEALEGGVVVPVAGSNGRDLVGIFNDEHVLARVVSRVFAGIHEHGDDVAGLHGEGVHGKASGYFAVRIRLEAELLQDFAVVEEVYRNAVRPGGVGILVLQLGVFKVNVDPAVLGDDPLDERGFVSGRNDEVLLDLDIFIGQITFTFLIVFNVDRCEGIGAVAELIIPAVRALPAEIILGGGKIGPGSRRCCDVLFRPAGKAAQGPDGKLVLAAVIGDVVQAVDHQGDIIALRDLKRFHVKTLRDLFDGVRLESLLLQQLAVVIQGDTGAVRPVRIGVFVLRLRVGCPDADRAVLSDFPLDHGRAAVLAGIHVVALDLQPALVEVAVFLLIEVFHVVGIERFIGIAALEEPSVRALRAEVDGDVGNVLPGSRCLDRNVLFGLRAVDVDDRDVEGAAVIGGIALGADREVQSVLRRHGKFRAAEGDDVFSLGRRVHVLLEKQLAVLIHSYDDAVREVRIAVMLFEFRIFDPEVHVAAHGGHPRQHRVVVQRGMDEALAHGEVRGTAVDVAAVLCLMGRRLRRLRIGTDQIQPAVLSLRPEIRLIVRVVVLAAGFRLGADLRCIHVADVDVEAAAVISVVAAGGHHEVQAVAFLHLQIVDADLGQQFLGGADVHVFQLQQLAVLIDEQLHAVRVAGVRVAVDVLHVGQQDVDPAVLGRAPFQDGRCCFGSVEEIALDFQAVCAHLRICRPVKALDTLRAFRLLRVAVAVEPAVFPLFAEVLDVEGIVGAVFVILKGRFVVNFRLEGFRPGSGNACHFIIVHAVCFLSAEKSEQSCGADADACHKDAAEHDPQYFAGRFRNLIFLLLTHFLPPQNQSKTATFDHVTPELTPNSSQSVPSEWYILAVRASSLST